MRPRRTLADLLCAHRTAGFIGRERELAWFRYELERDNSPLALWWLHGPAGVGKTALLQRFVGIARGAGRATVVLAARSDPVSVMSSAAAQLENQGLSLATFQQRCCAYRKLWARINADPRAPRGLPARRRTSAPRPLTRALAEVQALTPGTLADHLRCAGWTPDEIALALDGPALLTAAFAAALSRAAETSGLLLAFDDLERHGPAVARWLYDLLTRHAAQLPAAISWVVAARRSFPDGWSRLRPAAAHVALAPLPPHYAGRLVRGGGGNLPLWVQPLLGEQAGEEAAARLMASIPDTGERDVLLAAAVPQELTRELLKPVLSPEERARAPEWSARLALAAYAEPGSDPPRLRHIVRETLLRHLQREYPLDAGLRHQTLAANARLPARTRFYHRLMAHRTRALPELLAAALNAAESDASLLPELAQALIDAAHDSDNPTLTLWATRVEAVLLAEDRLAAAQEFARWILTNDEAAEKRLLVPPESRARLWLLLGYSIEPGDRNSAREYYTAATREAPSLPAAWFQLARLHLLQGEDESALEALDRAAALAPHSAHILQARALALRRLGDHGAARTQIEQALALAPDDPNLWASHGYLLALGGNSQEALAAYDTALAKDPDVLLALSGRGEALTESGQYFEALGAFERALLIAPHAPFIFAQRAKTLVEMKEFAQAVPALVSALALDPADAAIWLTLGRTLRQVHSLDLALAAFDNALDQDPGNAWAHALRGETLVLLGRGDEALKALDQALALDPGLAFAAAVRGDALRALERPEEALDAYDRALAINPRYAWALAGKALALRGAESLEEALRTMEMALALAPDDPWIWAEEGETLRAAQRLADAAAAFTRAVHLDPDYSWAWRRLAESLRQLGDYPAALQAVRQALRDDRERLWLLAEQAELLLRLRHYDEAARAADTYVAAAPDSDWAHFLVAVTALARHERRAFRPAVAQAIQLAEAAVENACGDDERAWALFNRGLYYLVQGDPRAAQRDYEAALALGQPHRTAQALEDLAFLKTVGVWLPAWERTRARVEASTPQRRMFIATRAPGALSRVEQRRHSRPGGTSPVHVEHRVAV